MPLNLPFGLYEAGESGPLWRAFFADFNEAMRQAQGLADEEGKVIFVFSLESLTELAKMRPFTGDSPPRSRAA
jgi:hypothetical protein